jgi:hypothetical protein
VPKRADAIISQQRDVRTYAELWHASKTVLKTGVREPVGLTWQFLSSIVLTAFSFEAYMNHVGPGTLKNWGHLERLSPEAKLAVICEVLGVELPGTKGTRPQQTISKLFDFEMRLRMVARS